MERKITEISNISPTHKVGIKLFTEPQLENVFPEYRNFLNRIEEHRDKIRGLKLGGQRHYQYNLMYDNVFSILGKRGTGKTSVAFTLQKMLEENSAHPYDIILPIIIPEVIPEDCSALGWVLAIVKQRIQEFEACERTYDRHRPDGRDLYWDNCKRSGPYEEGMLSRRVDKLVETYFANKYNPSNESSFRLAVGNSARQAQNYYQFAQDIVELWDEWVEAIRLRYSGNSSFGEKGDCVCPLIYFIFDDVDLEPEKVGELLSLIIKYLSHPNVIVITTADEQMFLEVIENNLDKDIGRIPKEWRVFLKQGIHESLAYQELSDDNQDLISQTARLYLGKVMPTSTRYYLSLFSDAERKAHFYVGEELYLDASMCSLIGKLQKCRQRGTQGNMMDKDGKLPYFYLNFFGDTSRQIANAYLGAKEFIESLIKDIRLCQNGKLTQENYLERVYRRCRHAFHLLISANHNLSLNIDWLELFIDEIFRSEYNGWRLYINYAFLLNFLKQQMEEKNNYSNMGRLEVIKMALELYSLCLFIENVLLILEACTKEGITGRTQVYGTRGLADFVSSAFFEGRPIFRKNLEAGKFLEHYKLLLNQLTYMQTRGQLAENFQLKYFHDLADVTYEDKELSLFEIQNFYNKDRVWLAEVVAMLSMVYGNMYLLEKTEVENCLIYWFQRNLYGYQQMIYYRFISGLQNSLEAFNLKDTAARELERLNEELKGYTGDFNEFSEFTDGLCMEFKQEKLDEIKQQIQENNDGEIASDEEVEQAYRSQCVLPVSIVIRKIEEECQYDSLLNILERCREHIADDIFKNIGQRTEHSDNVLQVLKVLFEKIKSWENRAHHLYIKDVQEFLNGLDYIGELLEPENAVSRIWNRLVEILYKQDFEDKIDLIILNPALYMEMKDALEDAAEELNVSWTNPGRFADTKEKESRGVQLQMNMVLRNFDVAVNLESRAEMEDAIEMGLVVQLAKQFQKAYLYQVILERYGNRYNFSSAGLEKMGVPKTGGKKRNKQERDTYYYRLFQKLDQIVRDQIDYNLLMEQLEEDNVWFSEDEKKQIMMNLHNDIPFMKNFIERNSSGVRSAYIGKLLREVEDESVSY